MNFIDKLKYLIRTTPFHSFILIILLSTMASCNKESDKYKLSLSEEKLNQIPDSALIMLESISNPQKMPEEDYAKYSQLLVLAHLNNKISIKEDTLIRAAVNYYKNIPSKRKDYVISLLLLGNVYEESDSVDKAKACFVESYNLSDQKELMDLHGLSAYELGGLYKYSGYYREGINWFYDAADTYTKNDRIMRMRSLRQAADCYVLDNRTDSAMVIYDRILAQVLPGETEIEADIYKNMAVCYKKAKLYDKSIEYINKSIAIISDETYLPLQYTIQASIFDDFEEKDSSGYYYKLAWKYAKEQNNAEMINVVNEAMFKSRYPKMLDNYLLSASFSDSLYQKQRYSSVIMQEFNKISRIEQNNRLLEIERERYLTLSVITILCLISFLLYYRISKHKKKMEYWREIENKDNVISTIRASLYKRLTLYQKMIRLSISPAKAKHQAFLRECNKLLFDKDDDFVIDWEVMEELCDHIFDNYMVRVKAFYPDFSEIEERIILLLKLGFNTTEISTILEKSIHTIYKYTSNMRKKLDVPENQSIIDFLDNVIN